MGACVSICEEKFDIKAKKCGQKTKSPRLTMLVFGRLMGVHTEKQNPAAGPGLIAADKHIWRWLQNYQITKLIPFTAKQIGRINNSVRLE